MLRSKKLWDFEAKLDESGHVALPSNQVERNIEGYIEGQLQLIQAEKMKKKVIPQMQAKTVSWNYICHQILAHPEVQLARKIISLRKASGLSQRKFATLVGMKQPQLARIEAGNPC